MESSIKLSPPKKCDSCVANRAIYDSILTDLSLFTIWLLSNPGYESCLEWGQELLDKDPTKMFKSLKSELPREIQRALNIK